MAIKTKKKAKDITSAVIVSSHGDELDQIVIVNGYSQKRLLEKLELYLIGIVQSWLASRKLSRARLIVDGIIEDLLDLDNYDAYSVSGYEGFIQVEFTPQVA